MKQKTKILGLMCCACILVFGCSTSYKATPVPFKDPSSYPNVQYIGEAKIAAKAFDKKEEAQSAFGFDVRGAGMLPVQVIFDNQGDHPIEIDPQQTFLEDSDGNIWPILRDDLAYERATKYSQSGNIVKEGAYHGVLGAAAGSILGAAVGVVTGDNVLAAAGKGAAVGAAAGATIGGAKGYGDTDPQKEITKDLKEKSLENKPVPPKTLAYGFIFFPGEAGQAKHLRLKIREKDTGNTHILQLGF